MNVYLWQSSLTTTVIMTKMAPFEALYGRRCRTLLNWSEPGERWFFGIDMVTEAEETVWIIQENMKAAQSCQKSYTDKRRTVNLQSGRLCLFEGITNERGQPFWGQRQVSTSVHWTFSNKRKVWNCGIPSCVTQTSGSCAQCISCIMVEKVSSSDRIGHRGWRDWTWARSNLRRVSY
jgi:hypothetical protein